MAQGRPGPQRVALVVCYVGTRYNGFQRQPRGDTVQRRIEDALSGLAGAAVTVRGAGRTDAGVHAAGQVVDFLLPDVPSLPVARLAPAVSAHLPDDIAVATACAVPDRFHARLTAMSKRYRYLIWTGRTQSPFWRPYAWHYHSPLDVAAMQSAAAHLVGRRDMAAFAGAARPVNDATRTMYDCRVWTDGPWVAVEVEADGFLYRMVRCIAGTLWRAGTGALRPADVASLVAERRRADAGPVLPPHGLCLLWVRYPPAYGLPEPGYPAWPVPPGPSAPPT